MEANDLPDPLKAFDSLIKYIANHKTQIEKDREELIKKTQKDKEEHDLMIQKDRKELEKREEAVKAREDRLKSIRTKSDEPIVLNVGGKEFKTTRITLWKAGEGSMFRDYFSEVFSDKEPKEVFIDRNGELFGKILDYLRNGKIARCLDVNEKSEILQEAIFYGIDDLVLILDPNGIERRRRSGESIAFEGGNLLSVEHMTKLVEWTNSGTPKWNLIHKSSTHGFGAAQFHTNCNNKGPTITVIKSKTGHLFGGYASVPWKSVGGYGNDPSTTSLLFTLTNPHNIPPTSYSIKTPTQAIYDVATEGPSFGSSCDLSVANDANVNSTSYSRFPASYNDTTGKANNTFTGQLNFQVEDMEVYSRN